MDATNVDLLTERERAVKAAEQDLATMKAQWESLKKKVASQDKRLAETRNDLGQKEKYIKKVLANEKKMKEELAAAKKKVASLQTADQRAADAEAAKAAAEVALKLEEQRSAALAGEALAAHEALAQERVRISEEAQEQTEQLKQELDTMRAAQQALASEAAEDKAVRQRESAALAAAVAAAEAERGKLTEELARRATDLAEVAAEHGERLAMLERERDGALAEAASARDALQDMAAAHGQHAEAEAEAAAAAAAKRKADGARAAALAESRAEAEAVAAAAEMRELKERVASMQAHCEKLREAADEDKTTREVELAALASDLEVASGEQRRLESELQGKLARVQELEDAKRAAMAAEHQMAAAVAAAEEATRDAQDELARSEEDVTALRARAEKAEGAVAGATHELEERLAAMTQTAEELRDDLAGQAGALATARAEGQEAGELRRRAEAAEDAAERVRAEAKATAEASAKAVSAAMAKSARLQDKVDACTVIMDEREDVGVFLARLGLAEPPPDEEDVAKGGSKKHKCTGNKKNKGKSAAAALSTSAAVGDEETMDNGAARRLLSKESKRAADASAVEAVWGLVEDWLSSVDYQHTLECLRSERSCVRFDSTSAFFASAAGGAARKRSEALTARLLAAFDGGDAAAFESAWATHVPPSLLRGQQVGDLLVGGCDGKSCSISSQGGDASYSTSTAVGSPGGGGVAGSGGWQTTRVRGLLLQVHAHFALFPLRQRLRDFQECEAAKQSPRGGFGGSSGLPPWDANFSEGAAGEVAFASSPLSPKSGGVDGVAEPELYPATLAERLALERFQRHLDEAATSDDAVALSSDPALAHLFALPQHPRPWIHPSLAPLLALETSAPIATGENIEGQSGNLLWTRAGYRREDGGDDGKEGDTETTAGRSNNQWVLSLRADLEELLSLRLLLVRPPALLVLHRAYVTWQSLLTTSLLKARRQADDLRSIAGSLVGLSVQLLAEDADYNAGDDRESGHHAWHRQALNKLRRAWEAHCLSPDDPTAGDLQHSLERMYGASLSAASPDKRGNRRLLPGGLEEAPNPLRGLSGGFGFSDDDDGEGVIGGGGSGAALVQRAVREIDGPSATFLSPPLDVVRIGKRLRAAADDSSGGSGGRLAFCAPTLRALGDRLCCPSWRVRQQTADDCVTGDLFGLLTDGAGQPGGGGDGDSSDEGEGTAAPGDQWGLLSKLLLPQASGNGGGGGGDGGDPTPALALRVVAALSVRPAARLYFLRSPGGRRRTVESLVGAVGQQAASGFAATATGVDAAAAAAAAAAATATAATATAAVAFGVSSAAAAASACAALVQLLLNDPPTATIAPAEAKKGSEAASASSVEGQTAEQGLLAKVVELLEGAVARLTVEDDGKDGGGEGSYGEAAAFASLVDQAAALLLVLCKSAPTQLRCARALGLYLSSSSSSSPRPKNDKGEDDDDAKEGKEGHWDGHNEDSGVLRGLLNLFSAASESSSSSPSLIALQQSITGGVYCLVRAHPSLLLQARTLNVEETLQRAIAASRAPLSSGEAEGADARSAAQANLEWQAKCVGHFVDSTDPTSMLEGHGGVVGSDSWDRRSLAQAFVGADSEEGDGGSTGGLFDRDEERGVVDHLAALFPPTLPNFASGGGQPRQQASVRSLTPEEQKRFAHMEDYEAPLGLAMEPPLREFYLAAAASL